jgi:hypothetical protein
MAAASAAANAQQQQQQRAPAPAAPAQQRPPAAAPAPAPTPAPGPGDDMKRLFEEQARALKGWTGGVAFQCVVLPAELGAEAHRDICTRASATASAVATQAKIRFGQAPDFRSFVTMILREQAVGLTVQVSTSDFKASVASLVVRIYASRPYSDVVSAGARTAPNAAQNPLATPRAGDVIFWEEQVVGSGPPGQLAGGIGPALDAKIKQFYAALLARTAPAPAAAPARR